MTGRARALALLVLVGPASALSACGGAEGRAHAGAPRVEARWGRDRGGRPNDAVDVLGLPPAVLRGLRAAPSGAPEWALALRVSVDRPAGAPALPAVVGRYAALDDRIRFVPRFPFTPGVNYRVDVDAPRLVALAGADGGGAGSVVSHTFAVPAAPPATPAARTTRVVAVHPAADEVPANLLRWYVEFSAPMEPGSALDHVRLLDETGRPVRDAFLLVNEELWDPGRRRLTLLFDPGRVKRGVRANLEMGRPIIAGHRYRLVVDGAWPDADGAPLASGFDKEFAVGPADAASPDPARWTLSVPRAGGRAPLRVSFGEPLDHALAGRMLGVERGGAAVPGTPSLAPGDSVWTFVPESAWAAGAFALRVDAALEDLAGNSVARVFDADRRRGAPAAEQSARAGAWRRIEFRVAP